MEVRNWFFFKSRTCFGPFNISIQSMHKMGYIFVRVLRKVKKKTSRQNVFFIIAFWIMGPHSSIIIFWIRLCRVFLPNRFSPRNTIRLRDTIRYRCFCRRAAAVVRGWRGVFSARSSVRRTRYKCWWVYHNTAQVSQDRRCHCVFFFF